MVQSRIVVFLSFYPVKPINPAQLSSLGAEEALPNLLQDLGSTAFLANEQTPGSSKMGSLFSPVVWCIATVSVSSILLIYTWLLKVYCIYYIELAKKKQPSITLSDSLLSVLNKCSWHRMVSCKFPKQGRFVRTGILLTSPIRGDVMRSLWFTHSHDRAYRHFKAGPS